MRFCFPHQLSSFPRKLIPPTRRREKNALTGLTTFKTAMGPRYKTRSGVEFSTMTENLPLSFNALRQQDPNSRDAAVLECKYEMKMQWYTEAHKVALKQLEVDPNCVYAYYASPSRTTTPCGSRRWLIISLI